MLELNIPQIKRLLNFKAVVPWLIEDAHDDFFPDALCFRDINDQLEAYLTNRQHRMLSFEQIGFFKEYVPKKNLMLREAICLHPIHRIIYLAVLHYLIPKLDHRFLHGVYSYRSDQLDEPNKYPFGRKMERWKAFHNDFRGKVLENGSGAVLLTDLSSFYDHINVDQLCLQIQSLLGAGLIEDDKQVIELLRRILNQWSSDGYGIPQNMDPSNLFGSLYLHHVDEEMSSRRYQYFRWVDDIRIVAKNREQAIRALHDLQRVCEKHRLFLASNKTEILTSGDAKFDELLNVEDDTILSEAEDMMNVGDCDSIASRINDWFARLEFHAGPTGDDRRFRAYANRIIRACDFERFKDDTLNRLTAFVLPRFESHPERSDQWSKMLRCNPTNEVKQAVEGLLLKPSPLVFDWQRFYLWRLVLHLPKPISSELLQKAIEVSGSTISHSVSAQAILVIGKHGNNTNRERVFIDHFTTMQPCCVQRAILIAIQELPIELRDRLYRRSLDITPEHKELIAFLQSQPQPYYGIVQRTPKNCRETPRTLEGTVLRGIGLVHGAIRRFRLSYSDYDYE